MISCINIYNFLIIKDTEISFENGFNVISGDTGAGKSLIFEAILLCAGARWFPSMMGAFDDYTILSMIIQTPTEDLLFKREIFSHGTSKMSINGKRVSLKRARSMFQELVSIVLQGESLMDTPDVALNALDCYANLDLSVYQSQYHQYNQLKQEYDAFIRKHESKESIEHELFILDELSILDPSIEDYESLTHQLKEIDSKDSNQKQMQSLLSLLHNTEFTKIWARLYDGFMSLDDAVLSHDFHTADTLLTEVKQQLLLLQNQSVNSKQLTETIECRLALYHPWIKRYTSLKLLVAHYTQLQELRLIYDDYDIIKADYKKQITALEEKLGIIAKELQLTRLQHIKPFLADFKAILKDLYLDQIEIDVSHQEIRFNSKGVDEFHLIVSLNQGNQMVQLSESASGGEKSRFNLAMGMLLAMHQKQTIYLFDEVDTGVSGRVALAIGEKMKSLGQSSQVIAITHLATVASCANSHIHITKQELNSLTHSQSTHVQGEQRIEVLASMMSGSHTEASLTLASQLLEKGERQWQ